LSRKKQNLDEEQDVWKVLNCNDEDDFRTHKFRFMPSKQPGVQADLNTQSTPFQCFVELFNADVQDKLISFVNTFAEYKIQQHTPLQKHSRYGSWYPLSRYELFKMLAVIIAMGIDRRPNLSECKFKKCFLVRI